MSEEVIRYLLQKTAITPTYSYPPVTYVDPYPAYYYTPYYTRTSLFFGFSAFPHTSFVLHHQPHHITPLHPAHNGGHAVVHAGGHGPGHGIASAGHHIPHAGHNIAGAGHNDSAILVIAAVTPDTARLPVSFIATAAPYTVELAALSIVAAVVSGIEEDRAAVVVMDTAAAMVVDISSYTEPSLAFRRTCQRSTN